MPEPKSSRRSPVQLQAAIRRHKRAVLIVNTRSRKGAASYRQAKRLLRAGGIELSASYAVKKPQLINQTITKALSAKPELLIVGSGDGTISEVVDHLANQDTVLGFIPLGTTNNFARSAGIPLDLPGAVEAILHGSVQAIDLGVVNGNDYFANVASIGLSVELAATVTNRLKRLLGRLAYPVAGLRVLARHRAFRATIRHDGGTMRVRTHQLIIANGRSHAGRSIARDASIDSQSLTIFRLGRPGRWQLIKALAGFSLRQNRSLAEKDYLISRRATIATDRPCAVEIDGEIKTTTPASFDVAAGALYIVTPVIPRT